MAEAKTRFTFVVEIESDEDDIKDAQRVVESLLDEGFDTGSYREIQQDNGCKSLVEVKPLRIGDYMPTAN